MFNFAGGLFFILYYVAAIALVVLLSYWVIRRGVRAGVLDAHRQEADDKTNASGT